MGLFNRPKFEEPVPQAPHKVYIDCPDCGTRHYWDTSLKDQRCPRCKALSGRDVDAIIEELRKNKSPGQHHILNILEILNAEIKELKSLKESLGG